MILDLIVLIIGHIASVNADISRRREWAVMGLTWAQDDLAMGLYGLPTIPLCLTHQTIRDREMVALNEITK